MRSFASWLSDALFDFSFVLFSLEILAFIVEFSAPSQGDFYLDPSAFEVDRERNDRESFFAGSCVELFEFSGIQEQLSWSCCFVILNIGVAVGLDVGAHEKRLSFFHFYERLLDVGFASTKGFHLGSQQAHASLKGLEDFVFVSRFFVASDHLDGFGQGVPFLRSPVFSHFHPRGNTFPARPAMFGGFCREISEKWPFRQNKIPLFKSINFKHLEACYKKSSLKGDQMG